MRLALVAGNYDAVVAQKSGIVECHVTVSDGGVTEIDTRTCRPVVPDATASKGVDADAGDDATPRGGAREIDHWAVEVAAGFIQQRTDAYTSRLNEFGYEAHAIDFPTLRLTVGASRRLTAHLAAVVQVGTLAGDRYDRSIAGETDTVSFHAYGGGVYLRTFTDLGSWFGLYGQAGAGLGLGVVGLETQQTGVAPSSTTTSFGYLLGGAVGATARLGRVFTLFGQLGYDYAPVIHNLIGDTHDGGGFSAVLGARFHLGDER